MIELKKSIFEANDRDADNLRAELKSRGVYLLNLMSAPGTRRYANLQRSYLERTGRPLGLLGKAFPRDGKVSLMMQWVGAERDVADPWYTGDFEAAYRDIEQACRAILQHLTEQ